jgi:hypothetical protein
MTRVGGVTASAASLGSMGVPPMIAVIRDFDRYSKRIRTRRVSFFQGN